MLRGTGYYIKKIKVENVAESAKIVTNVQYLYLCYCCNCPWGEKVEYKSLLNWFFISLYFKRLGLNAWEVLSTWWWCQLQVPCERSCQLGKDVNEVHCFIVHSLWWSVFKPLPHAPTETRTRKFHVHCQCAVFILLQMHFQCVCVTFSTLISANWSLSIQKTLT